MTSLECFRLKDAVEFPAIDSRRRRTFSHRWRRTQKTCVSAQADRPARLMVFLTFHCANMVSSVDRLIHCQLKLKIFLL